MLLAFDFAYLNIPIVNAFFNLILMSVFVYSATTGTGLGDFLCLLFEGSLEFYGEFGLAVSRLGTLM